NFLCTGIGAKIRAVSDDVGAADPIFLLRSWIGVGLTAMRDNEEGAAAIGVNITRAHPVLPRHRAVSRHGGVDRPDSDRPARPVRPGAPLPDRRHRADRAQTKHAEVLEKRLTTKTPKHQEGLRLLVSWCLGVLAPWWFKLFSILLS